MPAEPEERQKRIEELFHAAVELPPEQRSAFLDVACGPDASLRRVLDELIQFHEETRFLSGPSRSRKMPPVPCPDATRHTPAPAEGVGAEFGNYRLIQEIGSGTFGTVFMAEQLRPVRRQVAIKRLNPGMNSKAVLARFEAERQALALMDHPCIAKIYDAGQTPNHYPFFVMELVRGVSITEYCQANQLDARRRLELFSQVCHAVHHAHQKGVIHRDIKPSNVLVANYDDRPVPKVIDFGIAKALGQSLTEQPLFTAFGTLVGTFNYMSPEQATFNALDVDTRTDVYSLGALLYELLTGDPPLTEKLTPEVGIEAWMKVIREVEPVRPSTRLSSHAAPAPAVSGHRSIERMTLSRLVRGDVDWIVMKALSKPRAERYPSASDLARDVERYLAGLTVEARPPTLRYQAGKFLRRHRGPALASGMLLISLVGGVVGTTLGMVQARHQKAAADTSRLAEQRAREASDLDRNIARRQQAKAEAAALRARAFKSVLDNSLALSDPFSLGSVQDPADNADRTAAEIESRTDLAADARGPIYTFLARVMAGRRQTEPALRYAKLGLDLTRQSLGPDAPETLDAMVTLAWVRLVSMDGDGAKQLLKQVEPRLTSDAGLREVKQYYLVCELMLAWMDRDGAAAEQFGRQLVETVGAGSARMSPDNIHAGLLLTVALMMNGKLDEAARQSGQIIEDARREGVQTNLTLTCELFHTMAASQAGTPAETRRQLLDLLPRLEKSFGERHLMVAVADALLAQTYAMDGMSDQAQAMGLKSQSIIQEWSKSPRVGTQETLMFVSAVLGNRQQVMDLMAKQIAAKAATQPADRFTSERAALVLMQASQLFEKDDGPGAVALLESFLKTAPSLKGLRPDQQIGLGMSRFALCIAYVAAGRTADADRASAQAVDDARAQLGPDSDVFSLGILSRWFLLFLSERDAVKSLALLDNELAGRASINRPGLSVFFAMARGLSLAGVGRIDEAKPLLEQAISDFDRNPFMGLYPQFRSIISTVLAAIYMGQGDRAGADRLITKYHLDPESVASLAREIPKSTTKPASTTRSTP